MGWYKLLTRYWYSDGAEAWTVVVMCGVNIVVGVSVVHATYLSSCLAAG